jgi:hypothetical protein
VILFVEADFVVELAAMAAHQVVVALHFNRELCVPEEHV